jgi:hypothetical protein
MSVGLITSAAYINQEMAAEFGPLPPAFLPLGNGRLFRLQAALLAPLVDRILLSLPQSFCLPPDDAQLLESLGVTVAWIPDGLPLAESVMLALVQGLSADEQLYILHGDTLLTGLEHFPADGLSVHTGDHPYSWARLAGCDPVRLEPMDDDGPDGTALVSGMFGFSHGLDFLRCLGEARSDFLAALNLYAVRHPQFVAAQTCGQWLDLGHLNTYYVSRRAFTTQRAFNNLSVGRDAVCKTSHQSGKMEAEANWFEQLPPPLRGHVPAYLGRVEAGSNQPGYHLSYEYLCPLSDLYVFGAVAPEMWRQIMAGCADVLERMRAYKPAAVADGWFPALYGAKTIARLRLFAEQSGVDPTRPWILNGVVLPAPFAIAEEMDAIIGPPSPDDAGILHGDFCFSNILYDFRRGAIKLVDPRGYVEAGRPDIFGDTRYDIGKLHHSVIGRYDFILAGYFSLEETGTHALRFAVSHSSGHAMAERQFRERICGGDPARERVAGAISVLLHLSMLPLHADAPRRQKALLANGYRLYQHYFAEAA